MLKFPKIDTNHNKYLFLSSVMSVRPSVARGNNFGIQLHNAYYYAGSSLTRHNCPELCNACLKGAIFRNSNCQLQIYSNKTPWQ